MSSTAWLLSVGFAVLMLLGVPFAFAIGIVVALSLVVSGIEPMLLPQTLVAGTQSFSLLAIPFFMLAGELMSVGGLSQRLIKVAEVFVRHMTGGLGLVTVGAATIFSAISGSAPATTAAIGAVMIPAMAARGYSKAFATAVAVSAGVLGPLIPPSIAFVIWGVIAEQSISKLFSAGILPGIIMAIGLMIVCWWHAKKNKIPTEPRASRKEIYEALRDGVWAMLAPVIVLGGIYGGVFTPTEAAVVSCVYALVIGTLVEKRIKWKEIYELVWRSMKVTSIVMSIIIFSAGFGILVAQEQLAPKAATWLAANIHEKWLMLFILNIVFFLVAAVMDEIAIMVIFGPLLIAIAKSFGIDPIHFGSIIVTNVSIGMAAPPIGYCLFVGMAISGLKLGEVAKVMWPFIWVMLVVLMIVTYVPQFSLILI